MIKTDFSSPHRIATEASSFFARNTILYGVGFGVMGALSNVYLSLNFFGDFHLYFGQIFVLLCLVLRGLNPGIIAAFISSTACALHANDPYLVVIFSLEILFVHVCMRKGYLLFQSSMSYWISIGIPLLLLLHALSNFTSAEVLFISAVTKGLNGLICISIVAIICWFLPAYFTYNKYFQKPPPLSSLIFSLCMLCVTLPAVVIAFFFIWQSMVQNEQIVERELRSIASQLATANNIELQRHQRSLETVATILTNNPQAKLQPLITATAANYELFKSVILVNHLGDVLRAAPAPFSEKLNELKRLSIQHEQYFLDARTSSSAFVTDALFTNDFFEDLIIFFVAPVMVDNQFNGLIQGAMQLEKLIAFNDRQIQENYRYIISDAKNRIIAHSEDLEVNLLANFDYREYKDPLINSISTLRFGKNSYLYKQSYTQTEWTITVMLAPHFVTSALVHYFFILVIATIVIITAFVFIAKSLSRKITKPIEDIAENFPNHASTPQIVRDSQFSLEMVKLTRKLIDSHELMTNFNQKLTEQVNDKTKQLRQLNRALYSEAQKDSLTQLLNKVSFNKLAGQAYRNCVRNNIVMSVIFIDIDHFKLVNDTYGHPFGDKCITAVANTIRHHCKRDTDIIGRYGGEEFIIMIVGGDIQEHNELISLIKDDVEKLRLIKDGMLIKMTISAGICSIVNNFSITYEQVVELSDNQLYVSKHDGRNRISSVVQ